MGIFDHSSNTDKCCACELVKNVASGCKMYSEKI